MTTAVVEVRAGCTAMRHDTASAYKKNGCRCETARRAETARKAKYDNGRHHKRQGPDPTSMLSLVISAIPPFRLDPRSRCTKLPDPDLMFSERETSVRAAKEVCQACPLQQECGDWAIETRQIYGVWGGIDAAERRQQIIATHRPAVAA